MNVLKAKRIPSLDGLRALSIGLVLYGHARLTRGFPIPAWSRSHIGGILAALGVCLFFVISGFLITTLILNERDRFGRVSLRAFYIRRSLRIFPAFYTFIAVAVLLR
ncbi:MAG: acyltransferase family protein, partial [Chthonomonadales bacterium]